MASSLIASPAVTFARRKEDASVTELERDTNKIPVRVFNLSHVLLALILVAGGVCFIITGMDSAAAKTDIAKNVALIQGWGVGIVSAFVGAVLALYGDMSDEKKVLAKKARKKSIQSSRFAAKKLGDKVIPILTKEHVEARIAIDAALRLKLDESGAKWNQDESDRIGVILFQDLARKITISSLITDRGMTTASAIEHAIAEMETQSVKPIQDGWL